MIWVRSKMVILPPQILRCWMGNPRSSKVLNCRIWECDFLEQSSALPWFLCVYGLMFQSPSIQQGLRCFARNIEGLVTPRGLANFEREQVGIEDGPKENMKTDLSIHRSCRWVFHRCNPIPEPLVVLRMIMRSRYLNRWHLSVNKLRMHTWICIHHVHHIRILCA